MHLKQLFWSTLGQSTYCACGLLCLRVSGTRSSAIPVATGSSTHFWADLTPDVGQMLNKKILSCGKKTRNENLHV